MSSEMAQELLGMDRMVSVKEVVHFPQHASHKFTFRRCS